MNQAHRRINQEMSEHSVVISHTGQPGHTGFSDIGIIKAHHRDVLRNLIARLLQGTDHADCRKIIDGNDGGGHRMILAHELPHGLRTAFNIVAVSIHNVLFLYRYTEFPQHLPVAQPFIHRGFHVSTAADQRNVLMAVSDQKTDQEFHSLSLIDIHLIAVGSIQLSRDQDRHGACHLIDALHIPGIRNQLVHLSADLDHCIHPLTVKLFQIRGFHLIASKRIAQHQKISPFIRGLFAFHHHCRIERVADIGNHQTDHLRLHTA